MKADQVLDASGQALWAGHAPKRPVHHGERGNRYLPIRNTERPVGAGIESSVRCRGRWLNRGAVECATLEWVDWFNNRRLREPIGSVPPAEFDAVRHRQLKGSAGAANPLC
jgi:transposase InsO family protein